MQARQVLFVPNFTGSPCSYEMPQRSKPYRITGLGCVLYLVDSVTSGNSFAQFRVLVGPRVGGTVYAASGTATLPIERDGAVARNVQVLAGVNVPQVAATVANGTTVATLPIPEDWVVTVDQSCVLNLDGAAGSDGVQFVYVTIEDLD